MKLKLNGFLTLLLAFTVQITFAQEKTVMGNVSDARGPLPGVTVMVKGIQTGIQTDFDGKYSITTKSGATLQFSFLGMKTVEKQVGTSNTINVVMVEDAESLDEVVITAFGIKRKPDQLTTSNQVVKSDELIKASPQNLASALTGKVSGLDIRQTNPGVNESYSITLRGMRSFSASNEALIVIDNVPSSTALFYALDPATVESINVMKGANGAALYGSRGSNGVILVTTKKGNSATGSKFSVNFKSTASFEDIAYLPERQTRYGQGWASGGVFKHFVYENGAWGPEHDGSMVPVGLPLADGTYRMFPYETLGSDNIKAFFKTGLTKENTVSISGGNSEDGFAVLTLGNKNRAYVIDGDENKRNSVSFRAGKQFGKLNLEGSITYVNSNIKTAGGTLYSDLLQAATNIDIAAFSAPTNETHWNGYMTSPYWKVANVRNFSYTDRINTNFTLGYKINDHINIKSTASLYSSTGHGYNYNNGYEDPSNVSDLSGYTRTETSSYGANTSSFKTAYGDVISNFDYQIAENVTFSGSVGATVEETSSTNHGLSGIGLTIPGFYNISNISGTPNTTDSRSLERSLALFASASFGYKDYLFLNLTGRNDWTSKLSLDGNSFFYPSAGVSFIPTKLIESLKDSKVIDRIKLSYSYVRVGNASGVGAYNINDTYSQASGSFYGNFPFGTLNSFIPSTSVTDPMIQPEFVTSNEVGLTMEFLKRRIRLDMSAYKGNTKNQISQISTSYASGLTNNRINIGAADTEGMEIDLGLTPFDSGNWKWDINASYATSKMTVTKVSDQSDEVSLEGGGSTIGIFATVGEVFPLIKGTDFVYDPQGHVVIDAISGNPLISPELEILGRSTPKYILGFNSSLSYKNFTLTATADYRTGHQFYSGVKDQLAWSGYLVESAQNGRKEFIYPNSVIQTSPGVYVTNTNVPTAGRNDSAFLNYYSNNYRDISRNLVMDATALKVREITLSYSLPKSYAEAIGLTNFKLTALATNPITVLSKQNRGYADPESSNRGGNAVGLSVTGNYPNTRTYGLSLNLTF
ncbi:SusC/RagA family TonB-linked outer membrane protein [uncultured Flavobacterium sp.]|uniref:SusC/RagA family TonB-linked outer membrane protein n=1 Tax=uncultured Flavobacterium sp. TaxID=165435 RepID=UPI0030CA1EE4